MRTHKFHSLDVIARQCKWDRIIDRFNADCTDGRVVYGNRHFRNGKQFYINDSTNSPFRKHNRERIFDFFDALHNDPETTDMPYPKVFISDDDCDYFHPGKLQEIADDPYSIYRSTARSLFPHVHLLLKDGLLNLKVALHEFGHYRDVVLRGRWDLSHHLSDEQTANARLYLEDQAADHAFRINWFFRPEFRLPDYCLLVERADVLRSYCCHYPTNLYLEWIIKNPDVIGGRQRYMSLRDSGGSIDWLKCLLRRQTLIRVLKPKLAAANSSQLVKQ